MRRKGNRMVPFSRGWPFFVQIVMSPASSVRVVIIRPMVMRMLVASVLKGIGGGGVGVVGHLPVDNNIEPGCRDMMSPGYRFPELVPFDAELSKFGLQVFEIEAGVKKRGYRHITGNSGEAIEKRYPHRAPCLVLRV